MHRSVRMARIEGASQALLRAAFNESPALAVDAVSSATTACALLLEEYSRDGVRPIDRAELATRLRRAAEILDPQQEQARAAG